MSGVLVLGAGGHATVVADILQLLNVEVIGFLDDDPATWGTAPFGLPVLGAIDRYGEYKPNGLVFGIGANRARKTIVERLGAAANDLWRDAIHPSAVVARSARLGYGVVVAAQAVINPNVVVGDHAIINTGSTVDHDCSIGCYAHIAPGVHLSGNVAVGEGALLGVGSQAIPGSAVGAWAVVGAGATVIHPIPENVIAKGTPARW